MSEHLDETSMRFLSSPPSSLFLHFHLVKIAAAIFQIAHAAIGVQLVQQIQIDIRNQYHLRVGRGLGALAVRGEGEVARREDTRLGILNVHVVYTRQVADTTRNDHKTFVLDGAGMGTDLDTAIGVLRIGHEGDKQNLHALVGHDTRQLGELHVVADQDTYLGTIRIERLQRLASAQAPTFDFVRSDVYLLVHLVRAVAAAEEAYVVQAAVFLDERHAARDDVDVVADGQLDEALAYLIGIGSQATDGFGLALVVEAGHERRVEVFGEEDKVALVVGHGIDEEFHLLEEVVQRRVVNDV